MSGAIRWRKYPWKEDVRCQWKGRPWPPGAATGGSTDAAERIIPRRDRYVTLLRKERFASISLHLPSNRCIFAHRCPERPFETCGVDREFWMSADVSGILLYPILKGKHTSTVGPILLKTPLGSKWKGLCVYIKQLSEIISKNIYLNKSVWGEIPCITLKLF